MGTKTFHRGLRDMKIALWTSENSWGTAYDVHGARDMSVDLEVETDELRGDDVVLDQYSKIIAARFRVAHGAVDLEAGSIFFGGSLVSNGDYEDLVIKESSDVPYIGIAGRIVATSGAYDLHLFAAKARMAGNLTLQAQQDAYMIPAAEFRAVSEGDTNGIFRLRKFDALTALEIPLRTTVGGL